MVMRGWMGLVFVGLVWGMAPTPSVALEPVYRCEVKGVPTFVSTPVKGHRCRTVKHAPPPPTPVYTPPPLPLSSEHEVDSLSGGVEAQMPPPSATPTRGLPPLPPTALPPSS